MKCFQAERCPHLPICWWRWREAAGRLAGGPAGHWLRWRCWKERAGKPINEINKNNHPLPEEKVTFSVKTEVFLFFILTVTGFYCVCVCVFIAICTSGYAGQWNSYLQLFTQLNKQPSKIRINWTLSKENNKVKQHFVADVADVWV